MLYFDSVGWIFISLTGFPYNFPYLEVLVYQIVKYVNNNLIPWCYNLHTKSIQVSENKRKLERLLDHSLQGIDDLIISKKKMPVRNYVIIKISLLACLNRSRYFHANSLRVWPPLLKKKYIRTYFTLT